MASGAIPVWPAEAISKGLGSKPGQEVGAGRCSGSLIQTKHPSAAQRWPRGQQGLCPKTQHVPQTQHPWIIDTRRGLLSQA